jgi:hypothetical protein
LEDCCALYRLWGALIKVNHGTGNVIPQSIYEWDDGVHFARRLFVWIVDLLQLWSLSKHMGSMIDYTTKGSIVHKVKLEESLKWRIRVNRIVS